jgi:RNA polymerase sigma-70 factor (ECF subfamily)
METKLIWDNFKGQLLGFIKKRVKNSFDAEDILQDIFIKIHLNIGTLSEKDRLETWVYRITRNAIIDFYRKDKKNSSLDQIDVEDVVESLLEQPDFYFTKCLMPLIEGLPAKYQEAFVKTELEGISQKVYAEELGISYSGAKSRVQRAKVQLQSLFVECCGTLSSTYEGFIEASSSCSCSCVKPYVAKDAV